MSTIQRASKPALDLNHEQITACRKHAGAARWASNWGVARKLEAYRTTGKNPSAIARHRELNALQRTDVPWTDAVSTCAPQEARRHLHTACVHVFRRCQLKQHGTRRGKVGDPTFKTRKRGRGSCRLTGASAGFADAVQLPRLGWLRRKERGYKERGYKERGHLPTDARILAATVSEQAGHGSVAGLVEQEQVVLVNPRTRGPVVGVDVGLKQLATLLDGTDDPNARHRKQRLKHVKRLQRSVSRNRNRSRKTVCTWAALYRKVATQRANRGHRLTARRAHTTSVVVIADRNVAGMLRNQQLAPAIGAVGFAAFRRQVTCTAAWYGCQVLVAIRWEPTAKTCSPCGWEDECLTLADRTFRCQACGLILDRELTATSKLSKLAGSSLQRQNACGEERAGLGLATQVKRPALKQEPEAFYAPA
jgi:putative transposase